MASSRVIIAAAGQGSRLRLPYPKTLLRVGEKPILVRLLEVMAPYDELPVIVASPAGRGLIEACLKSHKLNAELVIQEKPTGMGDAVLQAGRLLREVADNFILAWGDIAFLQPATVKKTHQSHLRHRNDFTFPTRLVDTAYTIVRRDFRGEVSAVEESRETGAGVGPGERDIGFFMFRAEPVLSLLERRMPGALGKRSGEHGFLYIISHLVQAGCKVEALQIGTEEDLLSVNSPEDADRIRQHLERL